MADNLLKEDFERLPSQEPAAQADNTGVLNQKAGNKAPSRFNPSGHVEDIFENTEKPDTQAGQAGFKVKPDNDLSWSASESQEEFNQPPTPKAGESQKAAKPSLSKNFAAISKPQPSSLTNDAEFDDEPIPSKRKYFIIGLLGLLVIGAGAAYWFFFLPDAEEDANPPALQQPSGDNQPDSQQNNNQIQNQPVTSPPEQDIISNPDTGSETNATVIDNDQDGLSDEEEDRLGTNKLSPDSDNDGLFDREEVRVYLTDPLNADSDNDGYLDGEEVVSGFNPKGPGSFLPPIR